MLSTGLPEPWAAFMCATNSADEPNEAPQFAHSSDILLFSRLFAM
jgi:hypothetical protein